MSTEQTPSAPQSGGPQPEGEDRMTILERRLAEIRSKSGGDSDAAPGDVTAEAASTTPPVPAAIAPADELPIEHPAEGPAHVPASEPEDAGTAEAPAVAETPASAAVYAAPAPGTPEAVAAAETAHHVPDAVTVDGTDMSAPQARAVAHYGEVMATSVEANPMVEHTPDHVETVEETAPVPTVELHEAADLEAAPEEVATLSTSSETPLAEVEEAGAAEAAAAETTEAPAPDAEMPDFAGPDLPAQATYLVGLLRRPDAQRNRKQIQDLTRQYEANVGQARTSARQKFAEGGADAEAFAFQQPEGQQELNKALQEFREGRAKVAKAEDASRADNLTKKNQLLDQLRELVEAAETKDSSGKLKSLQGEWKATGPVPQTDSQGIWDTYHGLLDIYYSKQGRFLEMKDLDRRRNLEAKEALIKRAESLMEQSGINKALDELTKLHDDWKHIGPVPNDQREPLWQRFIAASDALHQRRKEFVDVRSTQEKANLEVKKALLERILPFADFETDRVNLWRSKTDEIQEIKVEWEAAGLVPRAQADALNKQYWAAYKSFFNRKNDFFKAMDSEKNANVKAKTALIEQAEAALESADQDAARTTVIRIQKEWKEIGRVPEKLADKLWHRFRAACDAVFERPKHESRQREEKASVASAEQIAHLDNLAQAVNGLTDETTATLEGFRGLIANWQAEFDPTEAEPGRSTSDRSEEQFVALLGKYLEHVPGLSYAERGDLLFSVEIGRLKARPQGQQQLTRKEMALRKEINELENDHATLQTNLDFFARSKNAAQLREEYQGRMAEGQKRIDTLKKQLKVIRS